MIVVEIGERIRKIREELKMSREKFSEMIDISAVSYTHLDVYKRQSLTIASYTELSPCGW